MFPRLAEHSFTVGQSVSRTLPAASGGDPALTYSISGQPRGGLTINAAALTLSGTAGLGDAGTYTGHVPVTRPPETSPLLMSTVSDFVRLTVQRKCPPGWSLLVDDAAPWRPGAGADVPPDGVA